jgi:hypothetical protein
MLTLTPGVMQNIPSIHTPKLKEIYLLVFLQKERGVIEKKYILKKHRKTCAPQRA